MSKHMIHKHTAHDGDIIQNLLSYHCTLTLSIALTTNTHTATIGDRWQSHTAHDSGTPPEDLTAPITRHHTRDMGDRRQSHGGLPCTRRYMNTTHTHKHT